jgi:hypothetical protein
VPDRVCIHCDGKSNLAFFETEAARLAERIPAGLTVEFRRWRERPCGEKLHNRYLLTDIGGVSFGIGLDEGSSGETDDIALLVRSGYLIRWDQYAGKAVAFESVDEPRPVLGKRRR